MKRKITTVLASLGLLISLAAPQAASAADDMSLSRSGFTVTWDSSKLIMPSGCSKFSFNYSSNVGFELLRAGISITDEDGTEVDSRSEIGVPDGASGTWSSQICNHQLSGLGPYTITLSLKDYNSTTVSEARQFKFKAKSTLVKGVSVLPSKTSAKILWTKDWLNVDNYQIRISLPGSKTKFQKWYTGPSSWAYFNYTGLKRKTTYVFQLRSVTDGRNGTITEKSFKTK